MTSLERSEWFCSDPVVSREAVQLHLRAADPVGEVSEGVALHLLPVHVEVWTPADQRHQHQHRDQPPEGGACLSYLKKPVADKLTFSM